MNAAAEITTDDGDKVNHGWSQLDIAKHSTNTFVASLSDGDYVCIVTYSDGAKVLLDWTECSNDGREKAIAAIHSMRPERSTNLMAGITTGFSQFEAFPEPNDSLSQFGLHLILTTDGMPSSQWHPARGRDGYAPLVNALSKGLAKKRGEAARPVVTTIGIGYQLDSELLTKMSSTFLHMPDPGQIGPFIVNLLAAVRSTARLPTAGGAAANACTLVVSPASAIASAVEGVPGYAAEMAYGADGSEVIRIPIGSVLYDQPRHVLLKTAAGAAFSVSLELGGASLLTASSADATAADATTEKIAKAQELRLKAVSTLTAAAASGAIEPEPQRNAIIALIEEIRGCAHASDPTIAALAKTLESECVLGLQPANFNKWGSHYFRTLPCMLKYERRSNFRDECLQHFGKDARMREALFEEQSNNAEMRFATLAPPEPSLLRPQPTVGVPLAGNAGPATAAQPRTAAVAPRPMALPEEFMRGGGCFGPDATVAVLAPDGESRAVRVSAVRAGDALVGEGGRVATVVCVVMTECAGGRAQLTRLPNGTEITEWHPIREASTGKWRFPNMLGTRILRTTPFVYNFVLSEGHPTILVDGVPCAALGHGLEAPVVAHPYWGTRAVIDDLMQRDGWDEGRIVIPAHGADASPSLRRARRRYWYVCACRPPFHLGEGPLPGRDPSQGV